MDINLLIPNQGSIPVSALWFEGLGVLTLSLHFIVVNILLGSGLIAAYFFFKERDSYIYKTVSPKLPTLFALSVNLGIPPLLFLQVVHGNYFYTSAVISAIWWMLSVFLFIAGYSAFYLHQHRQFHTPIKTPACLLAGITTIVAISLILTSVLTNMENPEQWEMYFHNASGTILNLFSSTTVPRYLHFIFSSIAIGGLFIALTIRCSKKLAPDKIESIKMTAMKIFAGATMIQMATGLWWIISLKQNVMLALMGGKKSATMILAFAVLLTLPALAAGFTGKVKSAAVWVGLTVLAMTALRAVVRSLTLNEYNTAEVKVLGEISPLIVFLVLLLLGLAVLWYMLKLGFKQEREV
ncbi:hypothetical protein [Maridesulfovibrio bastinii]|uniref:hypothetical protein n=1 Tax=Maridesulfovibrio bastinii TaxID=47157 RepID=UPI0004286871|nr:hypothetical protein [Maridesulfovibrio bastinii]